MPRTGGRVQMRYLGIILLSLLVFVPGIFSLPPTDRDESRYVQASRQMLESGDYVDIRFQDAARYKKPAGIYWLHAAAAEMTGYGKKAPIWVFRTISVIGATLAVAGTLWLASTLFGAQAGLYSALAVVCIFGLAMEARIAKTDAALLATVIFAQGALAKIYTEARQGRTASLSVSILFWVSQGLGVLIKGPITPLMSVLTAGSLSIYDREVKWLRGLRSGRGFLIMLAIAAPWFVLISWKSGGMFWQQSVGKDLLAKVGGSQESHGFPPGYYSLTYALFVWPIAFLALRAGLHALNNIRNDAALRFLVAWYLPFWIVFELIPTKLPHYMLPAYPALAIAVGWYFANPDRRQMQLHKWQKWLVWLALAGLVIVTLALAFGPAFLEWHFSGSISIAAPVLLLAALAAGWLGSPLADALTPTKRLSALAVAASLTYGLLAAFVLPSMDKIWLSREIASAVAKGAPCPDSTLAITNYHEPSMVFLGGTKTSLTDAKGAAEHLESDPACAVSAVEKGDEAAFRSALGPLADKLKKIATVSGVNYSKGRSLEMEIYTLDQ